MSEVGGLATRLGWRVERRPRPGFAHVLGAAAGAFLVVGVVAFVAEADNEDPTVPGIVFTLLLIAAAFLVGLRGAGPLRAACVTALVLAVPLLWFFVLFGGSGFGESELRGVYLLTLVSYLVLYFATWTKGRAIFLAGALLVFAGWATFEVGDAGSGIVPFQNEITNSGAAADLGFGDVGDTTNATAGAALVIGLVFLGVGAALDRRGYAGAATPFVAVGAIETLAGAIVLGANESALLGGVLAIVAGAVVGVVGGRGDRRRATTWIGVIAVFLGCVAIISDIAPSSPAGVGGIAFGFALALGAIAWWLAPILGEPDDGDDRPRPTAPPGGTTEGAGREGAGGGGTATLPDAAAA